MDENLKLLLTLGTGAAVGAVITGIFLLVKTAVDSGTEHRQAMRNERIKIYVEFLANIKNEIWKIQTTPSPEAVQLSFPVEHLAKIDALGSRHVREAATAYAQHKNNYEMSRSLLAAEGSFLGVPGPNRARIEDYAQSHRRLLDLGENLIKAVRKDLRTPD